MNTADYVRTQLFEMQDVRYRDFHSKLVPNINPETIIGVRTPQLRKFAKELIKNGQAEEFLKALPHIYYDENTLHGIILSEGKDFDETVDRLEKFLPYVDNWGTCDLISPKIFSKHKAELLIKIREWMSSDRVYTIRFGIEMLMKFFLDEDFKPAYLDAVAAVKNDDYYVKMMVAWYFATALAKQYDAALPILENRLPDKWTHNKAIQKAVESYRITDEQKTYLKTLKIK